MKNNFFMLLAGLFIITACKDNTNSENSKEYAIISGEVTNYNGWLKLRNEQEEHELRINDNGVFSDTIPLKNPMRYSLENSVNSSAKIYLAPGANLSITIKGDNLTENMSFSGDGSFENNYLQKKDELLLRYLKNDYNEEVPKPLSEKIADIEKLHENIVGELESSKNLSENFITVEKKQLHYMLLNKISDQVLYYPFEKEGEKNVIPEKYASELKNLPIDRESDFRSSESYRSLVFNRISTKSMKRISQDTLADFRGIEIAEINKIPNNYIKGEIAFVNAKLSIQSSETKDPEELANIRDQYIPLIESEKRKTELQEVYELKSANTPGMPSPQFIGYENYKGGANSLNDFLGKYIYIDIWATWCSPCVAEIPYFEKLEKEYHDKNIAFVSISIDSKRDYDKWRKMIEEKHMKGVQLLADKDYDSDFIKAYNIYGIPKFILLDPEGLIINADAPRPSQIVGTSWLDEQGI